MARSEYRGSGVRPQRCALPGLPVRLNSMPVPISVVPDPFLPTTLRAASHSRQHHLRASILAKAREFLASDEEQGKLKIARLAEACGTTPQTIHNNFGTRAELLTSAFNDHASLMHDYALEVTDEPVHFLVLAEAYVSCASESPAFMRAMMGNAFASDRPLYREMQAFGVRIKLPLLRRMSMLGRLRGSVEPQFLSRHIVRLSMVTFYDWAVERDNIEELRKQLVGGTALVLLGALEKGWTDEVESWLTH